MTVVHFCTSASWGGLELYACTLMAELRRAGCTVVGVCLPGSKVEAYLKEHQIATASLPEGAPWSPKTIAAAGNIIRHHGADVVHVHFHRDVWTASLAMRGERQRRLFVGIYMGVPKKNDPLHRFIYRRIDGIFTSSHELLRRLPALYPVSPGKIHYLPYGRQLDGYVIDRKRREEIREAYGIQADQLLAGTMVRIDPGKGVADFVGSFQHLPEDLRKRTRYLVIGEPTRRGRTAAGESPFEPKCVEYQQSLERFVGEHGLSAEIRFTGYQSDAIGYLSAMDVFVFPSRDELYSLVVLDALALGLPVVGAAAGGTLDQIADETSGLLYPVGNSEALARQIARYARDPGLRKTHGACGRRFVMDHHAMENTISALLAFYRMERNEG